LTGEGVNMRVDKDDRYIAEQSNKDSTPSLKLPSFVNNFPKRKLIILGLAIVIIFLLLSLILYRSPQKKEPTSLTPPIVNDVASTDVNNNAQNDSYASLTDSQVISILNQPSKMEENIEIIDNATTYGDKQSVSSAMNSSTVSSENNITKANQNADETNSINPKVTDNNLIPKVNIKNDHYTIQLSASASAENLRKFAKQNSITDYKIYETKLNNSPWFVLIKGDYSSTNEAIKALKSLPHTLQKDKPWVKSGATINKEKAIK
jgi:Uncharacterized protein conserved in bacteria